MRVRCRKHRVTADMARKISGIGGSAINQTKSARGASFNINGAPRTT